MHKKNHQTLTRTGIRDAFHQKLNVPQHQATVLLEAILDELSAMILRSSSVKIMSFGTFLVHSKAQRMGRNPKTKEEAVISPRKSVSFRASHLLREQVQAGPTRWNQSSDAPSSSLKIRE